MLKIGYPNEKPAPSYTATSVILDDGADSGLDFIVAFPD